MDPSNRYLRLQVSTSFLVLYHYLFLENKRKGNNEIKVLFPKELLGSDDNEELFDYEE
jgi:hypothetical protein